MALPFKPEPLKQLIERYPQALTTTYDVEKIADGSSKDRPGLHPENIFDFEDGIRIIVSTDLLEGNYYTHFSGSSQQNVKQDDLIKHVIEKIKLFTNDQQEGKTQLAISKAGVIHILFQTDPTENWKLA
jgi:hypothetical protein